MTRPLALLAFGLLAGSVSFLQAQQDTTTVRVFIFAGQSNMVGSDSNVKDIHRFPPFVGLDAPQTGLRFSYCIGRENKTKSDGWVDLQSVNNILIDAFDLPKQEQKLVIDTRGIVWLGEKIAKEYLGQN